MKRSLLLILVLLAGCNPDPQDAPKPASSQPANSAFSGLPGEPVASAAKQLATLTITPDSYSSCPQTTREVAMVEWDASAAGVRAVKVMALGKNGVEGMFAGASKPVGSKQSGPWMGAGVTFVLRDNATNQELARTVAGSKPCE